MASGLRLIATAMVIRLVLAVIATLMFLVVVATKNRGGMDVVAVVLGAVGLVGQALMVIGALGLARQPRPPPSSFLAAIAAALGLAGMAVSGYVVATLWRFAALGPSSDGETIQAVMDALRQMPRVELVAALLGSAAIVVLVVAAIGLARHIGRAELAREAKIGLYLVVAGAAVYAFARLSVSRHDKTKLAAALIAATALQAVGLVIVVAAARRLASALLSPAPPAPELPRARSV